MSGRGLVFGNEYGLGSARIEMRITGTHRARSDGTPCKGNLFLTPPAGRSGALGVVARCPYRPWKGKSVSIHGYYSSFHYTLLYMVLGYEQVVLLGRTDGIIPPINTTQPIHFLRATCGPSVCGIYFNMNHTNLTNCAGVNLQLGKNSIRVSLTRPLGGSTPCD